MCNLKCNLGACLKPKNMLYNMLHYHQPPMSVTSTRKNQSVCRLKLFLQSIVYESTVILMSVRLNISLPRAMYTFLWMIVISMKTSLTRFCDRKRQVVKNIPSSTACCKCCFYVCWKFWRIGTSYQMVVLYFQQNVTNIA